MRDKISPLGPGPYLSVSLDIVDEMNQSSLECPCHSVQGGWRQVDPTGSDARADPRPVQGLGAQSRSLTIKTESDPSQTSLYGPLITSGPLKCHQRAVKHSDAGGSQLRLEEEGTLGFNTSQMVETTNANDR